VHERWKIANLCVINVVFTIQIRSRFVNMIFKPRHLQKCKTRIIVETRQVAIITFFLHVKFGQTGAEQGGGGVGGPF